MKHNHEQYVELKRFYVSQLPNKINALASAWEEYVKHPETENLKIVFRQTHNMSRSAGTYGYKELGDIAKKMDKMLRQEKLIDPEKKAKINDLINQLRETCKKIR